MRQRFESSVVVEREVNAFVGVDEDDDARRGGWLRVKGEEATPGGCVSCALVFAATSSTALDASANSLLAMALLSSSSASQCEFAKRCAWRCQSASVVM